MTPGSGDRIGSARRRRKTPETEIAHKIRMYARTYASAGQKERAEGMMQAASIVDELSARGPSVAAAAVGDDARIALLESRVEALERDRGRVTAPIAIRRAEQNGRSQPRAPGAGGEPSLSTGELRILAAAAQRGAAGVSNDELTAMVDYRATSLRTYLGNLRAAGYLTPRHRGRHHATAAGAARVAEHEPVPFGAKLYAWWMNHRLPTGAEVLLGKIAAAGEPIDAAALVGTATGLQATSVRTYLTELSRRRLITRPERGRVAIAPSLVET